VDNDAIRTGYAPIARGYKLAIGGELAGKPLDRAFLSAFAERCRGAVIDAGCGPGHVTRFLADCGALEAAGFVIEARLDREPYPEVEHQSRRCYLLARC
jgi:hypothetical protein